MVRVIGQREQEGVIDRLITYTAPHGERRVAQFLRTTGSGPAILFVHWYEPEAPTSNRTQFVEEARTLAKRGAICLLIETMWSDRDWFLKRTQADDYESSMRQVAELRLATDMLLTETGVDVSRFAYVGHDFGGMYGVLAGSSDPRPTHYVIMAATPRFHEWFLYYPKLEGAAREQFIAEISPLDPIAHVPQLAPKPILFQFATDDFHVPVERAQDFYNAAGELKRLLWYEAGHGLNDKATQDRIAWLTEQLGLSTED